MDVKLHRPQAACSRTGRSFAVGEVFYSALVRGDGGLGRLDVAAEAWAGPPDGTIAWWRSRYPAADEPGPVLAPVDALLDALEALDDEADAPLRYLLALELVRRRVLRIVDDASARPAASELVMACRRRDRQYRVRSVERDRAAADGVEGRLAALLWSGGAA
jgi:hypothetical protein